ncbi:ComF family protein [Bacillus sp. EAC]|uniref:ComF family protein n=1 Tax=Bacillus sp. EAC TaxID=1978338 RepID=UPI000B431463|nr:ComF family protein [Bacillus sp. EAC]
MICINCGSHFVETFSLHHLFFQLEEKTCSQCLTGYKKISGTICEICGGHAHDQKLCKYCEESLELNTSQPLKLNRSIYHYTDVMKEWLNRYKFYGDVTLATMFITDLREYYENNFKHIKIIVPIPLSEERLVERGFNQVEVLGEQAGFPLTKCLKRIHTEKQSKLNRNERLKREQIFSYCGEKKIQNMPILILDDVYTTGKTVRDAAIILLQNGASEVFSLTLIRA